jgi:uracil-DNA glycosylase
MITSYFKRTSKRPLEDSASHSTPDLKHAKCEHDELIVMPSPYGDVDPSAEELLRTLADESWRKALAKHCRSPTFRSLALFVSSERSKHTIYPTPEDTWTALNTTPLDQVKVVLVGQDPYHGPGQAHGLCFSVRKGVVVPPSLKNIYAELTDDPDAHFPPRPSHGYLLRWAQQGVLMLNTVLTVQSGHANSHAHKGWEAVTDEILRQVHVKCQASGKGVVFLLWGNPAKDKAAPYLNNPLHTVITTSHPSPLGARKTHQPFIGSRCFGRCNAALKKLGYDPIDWNVDGPLPVSSDDNINDKSSISESAMSPDETVP